MLAGQANVCPAIFFGVIMADKNNKTKKKRIKLRISVRAPRHVLEPIKPGPLAERLSLIRFCFLQEDDYVYALMASSISIKEWVRTDNEKPKGICVLRISEDELNFELGLNVELFNKLSLKAQQELIKIQMLKILHGHLTKRIKQFYEKYNPDLIDTASLITVSQFINPLILAEENIFIPVPELWKYPRNLAIEQYIEKLSSDGSGGAIPNISSFMISDGQQTINIKNLLNNISPEFRNLLNKAGFSQIDQIDHSSLEGEVDGETLNQITKQFIENLQQNLKNIYDIDLKSQGFVAGDALEIIKALNRPPKLHWHQVLRRIHSKYSGRTKKISLIRPSRRTTTFTKPDGTKFNPYMGRVHNPQVLALWIIDTSGSMSKKELRCVDAELKGMKARGCKVLVMQVDADVAKPPVEYDGRQKLENWFGRGGTSFVPGLEYAEKMIPKPDYIVYFTDGYGTAPEKPISIPVLWVLTSTGMNKKEFKQTVCSWGEVTELDVENLNE